MLSICRISNLIRPRHIYWMTTMTYSDHALGVPIDQISGIYLRSDKTDRLNMLKRIAQDHCVDLKNVDQSVQLYISNKDRNLSGVDKLVKWLSPPYMKLFHKISRQEDGVKCIVDMRTDLLNILSSSLDESTHRQMKSLSDNMKELLSLWFSVGFLKLERITWKSPCIMLEKISEYEAVHPIKNWPDIKRRVGPYRRCYVFTHSCLPNEPVVILHIALMNDISSSIEDIVKRQVKLDNLDDVSNNSKPTLSSISLPQESIDKFDAAIFYSVSSPQRGLHGIELGNYIIQQVGREIRSEFPHITKYSSLSPIPGFRDYLLDELQAIRGNAISVANFVKEDEYPALKKRLIELQGSQDGPNIWAILRRLLMSNTWIGDDKLVQLLREPLMRKCAYYLSAEKRRGYALNSVAHFHLRNGAVMWRLNWLANLTPRGLTYSCGMMMNYRYYIELAADNSQRYMNEKYVSVSDIFAKNLSGITSPMSNL